MKLKYQMIAEKEIIRKRIDKNREEIDYWLNVDSPLELKYIRINMLSEQNEILIKKLQDIRD